jgi:hypothetical protein
VTKHEIKVTENVEYVITLREILSRSAIRLQLDDCVNIRGDG